MGNTESTPPSEPAAVTPAPVEEEDSFQWPSNLYEEMRDMAAVSFLVYAFAYASDVARTKPGGIEGVDLSEQGRITKTASTTLPRSFTPKEILNLIETNIDKLVEFYPDTFGEGPGKDLLMKNLRAMQGTI
jgi:hypothetical protein